MDKTEIFLSTLGSFWRAIQIVFFAYAGMRLLEHFGATQIEAAAFSSHRSSSLGSS
jgi:hypothetical protein